YRMIAETFRQIDAITCLSATYVEKPFCDANGIKHAYVIPNGVDIAEFELPTVGVRESWGIGRRPFVLNVSNHAYLKGHPELFQLSKMLPKGSVVVNIGNAFRTEKLGAGRYGVRGGCYYACRVRSLFNGKVQLRQHIPRPSVVSALREADLLVHPSTRETSPLVILEAMAAGLPWVAFDAGNVREFPGGVV